MGKNVVVTVTTPSRQLASTMPLITDISPLAPQPPEVVGVDMYNHQRAAVQMLLDMMSPTGEGVVVAKNDRKFRYRGNVAVLALPPGSGKTLVSLVFAALLPKGDAHNVMCSSTFRIPGGPNKYVLVEEIRDDEVHDSHDGDGDSDIEFPAKTLVITPSGLVVKQWLDTAKNHLPGCNVLNLQSRNDFNRLEQDASAKRRARSAEIVVTTAEFLSKKKWREDPSVQRLILSRTWDLVIVDEYQTNFSHVPFVPAAVHLFVGASETGWFKPGTMRHVNANMAMIFRESRNSHAPFANIFYYHKGAMNVTIDKTFLEASIRLPAPIEHVYHVVQPNRSAVITHLFPDAASLVSSGASEEVVKNACETLRGVGDPVEFLMDQLRAEIQSEEDSMKEFYDKYPEIAAATEDDDEMCLDEFDRVHRRIGKLIIKTRQSLEDHRASLQRCSVLLGSTCSICLDDIDDPDTTVILRKCTHMFHWDCLVPVIRQPGALCPNCRTPTGDIADEHDRNIIRGGRHGNAENTSDDDSAENVTKVDIAVDLITKSVADGGRCIVYMDGHEVVSDIQAALEGADGHGHGHGPIRSVSLRNKTHVRKNYRRFVDGEVPVVFLDNRDPTGINLQCASDVIFMHPIYNERLRDQVIGRAQRPGRTAPLNVHTIAYYGE